jgi:hypothetical protein
MEHLHKTEEEIKHKKIKIARSRSGVPCLWESLTVFDDLVRSTIIYNSKKEPKSAFYINEGRDKQALVPITVGDYISKAFEDKYGIAISVFKITDISSMDNTATIIPIFRKSSQLQSWYNPDDLNGMIETTMKKLKSKSVIAVKQEKPSGR